MKPRDLELNPQQTVARTIIGSGHRLYPEPWLIASRIFIIGHGEEEVRVCVTLQSGFQSMVRGLAFLGRMLEMENLRSHHRSIGLGTLGVGSGNLCFNKSFSGSSVY